MFKTVTAAAAVMMTAALVVPTVSHAQDVKSVKVSYADLNLASAPGEQKLQRRIAFAVVRLGLPLNGPLRDGSTLTPRSPTRLADVPAGTSASHRP